MKYACNKCDDAFTTQNKLNDHEKLKYSKKDCHLARQPAVKPPEININKDVKYQGDKCDKVHATKSTLTLHIQVKHERVKYVCDKSDDVMDHVIMLVNWTSALFCLLGKRAIPVLNSVECSYWIYQRKNS